MKILALDSSGLAASVAVTEDDCLLAEYTVIYKKTHSQTLLPMLEEVRKLIELDLNSLDAIAVASGPGSFTGLRIGSATAKGLGLALGKPLVEVPTLEGLAYNLCGTEKLVCPLMDARRGQVYSGIYTFERNGTGWNLRTVVPQCAADISEIIEKVNALGKETACPFSGTGWRKLWPCPTALLPPGKTVSLQPVWQPWGPCITDRAERSLPPGISRCICV